MSRIDRVAELLRSLGDVKEEKGKEYGDTWVQVGAIMMILFPEGVRLADSSDFAKWHILDWSIGKLVRFANTKMHSLDSLDDLIVYLAILKTIIDEEGDEL